MGSSATSSMLSPSTATPTRSPRGTSSHRPLPAESQEKVGRRWRDAVDLVANLFQDGGGTLCREHARRHDVRLGHPGLSRGRQGTEQVFAVLLQSGVIRMPEIEV